MRTERELAMSLLPGAASRVVRAVDRLPDDDWSAPSLLPGWSRAHVVAHLALNAEALSRCLRGVVSDEADDRPWTMYDSAEQRDRDIAKLAAASSADIRDRLLAGTTIFEEAVDAVPETRWEERVERTPGGRTMRVGSLPGMRIRELEIHEVDLGAGYTTSEWSQEFAELLLDAMSKRVSSPAFELKPLDSSRTWVFGSADAEYPVPVVTGPAADAGWWLTGRPAPETLHCSHGELPTIEGW